MWREHPLCGSQVAWPARFWGPESLDPGAWRELASRLDPSVEIDALIAAVAQVAPRRVIDVGGGTGLLTRALAKHFGGCVVIEPSAAQVAGLPDGLVVARGRAEALPVRDGSVDAAIATWVLQYCVDPFGAVDELARAVVAGRTAGVVAIVQAAPDNELVEVYNEEARVAGVPPAHHGFLLAGAAERLERAGFAVTLRRLAIPVRASPDEAVAVADFLARLHFADHPRRADMVAATTELIRRAATRGQLRDDGVLLTAVSSSHSS